VGAYGSITHPWGGPTPPTCTGGLPGHLGPGTTLGLQERSSKGPYANHNGASHPTRGHHTPGLLRECHTTHGTSPSNHLLAAPGLTPLHVPATATPTYEDISAPVSPAQGPMDTLAPAESLPPVDTLPPPAPPPPAVVSVLVGTESDLEILYTSDIAPGLETTTLLVGHHHRFGGPIPPRLPYPTYRRCPKDDASRKRETLFSCLNFLF